MWISENMLKTLNEIMPKSVYNGVSVIIDEVTNKPLYSYDIITEGGSISPEDYQLEWKSSDESILTVDPLGNVTAVGKGKAYIGVRAANGKYDVCEVTVK